MTINLNSTNYFQALIGSNNQSIQMWLDFSFDINPFTYNSIIYADRICFPQQSCLPNNYYFFDLTDDMTKDAPSLTIPYLGAIGVTPFSKASEFGVFHQSFGQGMSQFLGLALKKRYGQFMIGGYNTSYFLEPNQQFYNWQQNKSAERNAWYISLKSLYFGNTLVHEEDNGKFFGSRISVIEQGIVIRENVFKQFSNSIKREVNDFICEKNSTGQTVCIYTGNCADLGISSFFVTFPDGSIYEIPSQIYLQQQDNPFQCLSMIYAQPDSYFKLMNAQVVLGHPLLLNYYTIFDVSTAQVAFVETTYTLKTSGLTPGAIAFLCLISTIFLGGIIGGIFVFRRNKREKVKTLKYYADKLSEKQEELLFAKNEQQEQYNRSQNRQEQEPNKFFLSNHTLIQQSKLFLSTTQNQNGQEKQKAELKQPKEVPQIEKPPTSKLIPEPGPHIIDTDVVIVGGGIAGASLACALSESEFFLQDQGIKKIYLLDHTKLPEYKTYKPISSTDTNSQEHRIPEPRVITLSPNSLRFFKSINVLQLCNHKYVTPFNEMLVYEEVGKSYMKFDLKEQRNNCQFVKLQEYLLKNLYYNDQEKRVHEENSQQMGASIENNHILAAILERLSQQGKVEIIKQKAVKIKAALKENERPLVQLEDGRQLQCKLLVGSDGEKSKTREEYGIGAWGYSYNQNGVVCTVSTLKPNNIAFQRFLRSGPLALLPLWGSYSSIVWSVPPEQSKELLEISDKEFIDRLNNAFHHTSDHQSFGGYADTFLPDFIKNKAFELPPIVDQLNTKRFAFPLVLQHSNRYAANRMALIGDAAHRMHPLAGQGLNVGLTDVAFLANSIVSAKKGGQDIGNYDLVLKDFESQAKLNAYLMTSSVELVRNSYMGKVAGSEQAADFLGFFRNIATDLIDSSEFLKYNFQNYASGNIHHPTIYEWETR